jgi:hypothetical protein
MLENENYRNNPSVYEDNTMLHKLSNVGERGDRERINNDKSPWSINIHLKK